MTALRKITVTVPARDPAAAQAYTGKGIAATVREGLNKFALEAQQKVKKLRGTFKFSTSLSELRKDRKL